MNLTKVVVKIIIVIGIIVSFCALGAGGSPPQLEVGKKLPLFKLSSLDDGKEFALEQHQGKVVIIHLWKCK